MLKGGDSGLHRGLTVVMVILIVGSACGCSTAGHGGDKSTPGVTGSDVVTPDDSQKALEGETLLPPLSQINGEQLIELLDHHLQLIVVVYSDNCEACDAYKGETLLSIVEDECMPPVYLLQVTPNYPWILEQDWADQIMRATRREAVIAPTTIFFYDGRMKGFYLGKRCLEEFQEEMERSYGPS